MVTRNMATNTTGYTRRRREQGMPRKIESNSLGSGRASTSPDGRSEGSDLHALPQDHAGDVGGIGAQRHANSDLVGSLAD